MFALVKFGTIKTIMVYLQIIFIFVLLNAIGSHSLNQTCSPEDLCGNNEICEDSICVCGPLSEYFEEEKQCLEYAIEYKQNCQRDEQCEWLGDKRRCFNFQCVCPENFYWYKGKCTEYKKYGDTCTESDICYNGYDPSALKCSVDGKCACDESSYYEREIGDCRKTSQPNGGCAIDLDCRNDNYKCLNGKCKEVPLPTHFLKNTEESLVTREGSCDSDNDCSENAVCFENQCVCLRGKSCGPGKNQFSSSLDNIATEINLKKQKGFGNCTSDKECTEKTEHSKCFKDQCVCSPGYISLDGETCIGEIGMQSCGLFDDQCFKLEGSSCSSMFGGTCNCIDYWVKDDTNRKCIKTSIQTNMNCLSNEWCNVLGPNSYCSITDLDGTCTCSSNADYNNNTMYCDKNESDEPVCLRDSDCGGANQLCVNEKCECSENFHEKDGACLPHVNGNCVYWECDGDNLECVDGVCSCQSNFVTDIGLDCYPVHTTLGSACNITAQCNIINTDCIESECACIKGYENRSGKCVLIKKVFDGCRTSKECVEYLEDDVFQCRNNVCQCPVYQKFEDGSCKSSGYLHLGSVVLILIITVLSKVFG